MQPRMYVKCGYRLFNVTHIVHHSARLNCLTSSHAKTRVMMIYTAGMNLQQARGLLLRTTVLLYHHKHDQAIMRSLSTISMLQKYGYGMKLNRVPRTIS